MLLNYNDDIEYFWDARNVYMKKERENYYADKETLSRGDLDYDEKIESLKAVYRDRILEALGKDKSEIESEHLKLSHAFGFPVGVVKSLKTCPVNSIIAHTAKAISLSKADEGGKEADYVTSTFPGAFLLLLTVSFIMLTFLVKR